LFKQLTHIIFIITILVSQGAEAFVSPEMPCSQEHMMMFDKSTADSDTIMLMSMHMDDSVDSCCQKECCCPAGLLSFAVLVDDPFKTDSDFTHTPAISFEPAIRTVFSTQLQRPPKNLSV
jgi:hypothetical protein